MDILALEADGLHFRPRTILRTLPVPIIWAVLRAFQGTNIAGASCIQDFAADNFCTLQPLAEQFVRTWMDLLKQNNDFCVLNSRSENFGAALADKSRQEPT